jgi:ankyrin repeat protein
MNLFYRSALHWSAKRGHKTIIQALLEYGADPNLQNIKGDIAANLTADLNIAQLLGAVNITDITTPKKDDNSFTPHYLAHPPLNARVDGKPYKPGLNPEQHNMTSNTMNKPNTCATFQQHPDGT